MFALVDCNNFYASCERVFRPDLNGKPVVILSNNDGCIVARSNEAKALGIPMGAPMFQYKKFCEQNNVHVFSSNYTLYGDMSARVMNILGTFTPEIEIYSIDEAFLKLEGFKYENLNDYGATMRQRVVRWTGIPISVGIAPTKALAKIANRIAKKFPERTKGVYTIDTEEQRIKALKWVKIEDVWGIGRRHAKRLQKLGVYTAYDFTQLSDGWVRKQMTVVGLRLKKDLSGEPTLNLEEVQRKKAIATTRSFEEMYSDYANMRERITTFAVTCSEKLRKQKSCCALITVFIHTNPFREDLPQYRNAINIQIPYPTNSAIVLAKYAEAGLKRIFREGFHYKKAGIIAMNIVPEQQRQTALFTPENPKHQALMNVVDRINQNSERHLVKLAAQDLKRIWKMNQDLLSPKYTTRLSDVIEVKV